MKSEVIDGVSYLVSYEVPATELQNPSAERVAELAAMPYALYLRSPEWRERRRIEIQAAEYKCGRCRCYRVPHLEVHHLTYERVGHEYPEDLVVLCPDCHRKEHGL